MFKKIFAVVLGIMMIFTMMSCTEDVETVATTQPADSGKIVVQDETLATIQPEINENTEEDVAVIEEPSTDKPSVDKPFEFSGLEITVGSNYEFVIIDNEYSDYYGKTAVRIPITVKNISTDFNSLNSFYFKTIGSQGTDVDSLDSYFDDDISWNGGDLRPEASYIRYMYVEYDGNGLYTIVFDNWDVKVYIDLNIAK